jgi:nucleoside-diphosphate-sugar epimerase
MEQHLPVRARPGPARVQHHAASASARLRWKGEFVVLPAERTPRHLLKPGNAAQHWTASSVRIRHELGYEEPVVIEDAIRQTISWERKNPPAEALLSQFRLCGR